jgi:tetratricopeptide (TPR) repeat protein
MAGNLSFTSGNLREALSHHEAGAVHSGGIRSSVAPYGFLRGSSLANVRAQILHLLGRVSEAAKIAEEGLRLVREFEFRHFPTLVITLALQANLYHMRREPRIACSYADEAVALSEEVGFVSLHLARVVHGCALAEMGQFNRAIDEMEAGIGTLRNIGGAPRLDYYTAILAQTYAKIGLTEKALKMLNESLAHIERTGEKVDQAEMFRLRGELLLMLDPASTAEAENCFRLALEVASTQEAKWWELRATMSLARLLRDSDRSDEARIMLSEIYNWFTEGFDLPDLIEAKALLDELN